jgi:hypothetical protein
MLDEPEPRYVQPIIWYILVPLMYLGCLYAIWFGLQRGQVLDWAAGVILLVLIGAAATVHATTPSRRFSLRTLLIATTLIAVVLGLVVWAL